jgi:hypothetical protein
LLAARAGGEDVVASFAEKLREHLTSRIVALHNKKLFARGVQSSVLKRKLRPHPGALS